MTDTLNSIDTYTDPTDTSAQPGEAAVQNPSRTDGETANRECIEVDPTTLIIGDNVRATAHLDRQFLASLRQHGVMNPIQAVRADDGTLTVKRGQRRTLGAIKAGLISVPVLIVPDDADEADRIVKQWHENERRDALTETDRLAAVEQLSILGVPAGSIARRLGTPKKQVEAAVVTNGSETAKAAVVRHALTLTDAALIAEFEDDPDTVKNILQAVEWGRSTEHVAQRARDAKVQQQAQDEAVAALGEAGVTVIDSPGYGDKTIKELREIRMVKRDGQPKAKAPTEAEHASCPGHAAYVTVYHSGQPQVTYVCTDAKANRHALYSPSTGGYSTTGGDTGGQAGGGWTEEQKAERRTLIANNKAWDSAERVRRAWLTDAFLPRTTPPKGAETFIALAVAHGEHPDDAYRLHADLSAKGEETPGEDWERRYNARSTLIARADAATPRQVLMLALALLVCEWESTTSRNTWRRPSERDRRYLTALIGWGYQPSDVEGVILAQADPVEATEVEATEADDTAEPVEATEAEPAGREG